MRILFSIFNVFFLFSAAPISCLTSSSTSNSLHDDKSASANNSSTAEATAVETITPEMFGATGDGKTHKLSEKYTSLNDAKKDFPNIKDLNITLDNAAFQKAIDMASNENSTVIAEKSYVINFPLITKNNVTIDGKGKGIILNDRSRQKSIHHIAFFVGNYSATAYTEEGYTFFNIKGSVKAGNNFVELQNVSDASSLKEGDLISVISTDKRGQNLKKTLLPYNVTVCKITNISGSKISFEFPFDENIPSAQIAAKGSYDNLTEMNYQAVDNVTIQNLSIDASHITLRTNGYNCKLKNIKINNAIRIIGLNAFSHSSIENISGTFAWRCIEVKTGTNNLLIHNINASYKPIKGFEKSVDAISTGEYNRNITIDSFYIDFKSANPQLACINLHSRKATIKNGTIICKSQTKSFLKLYNVPTDDPTFGCYKNVVSNVKFYGGNNMKQVLDIGENKPKKPGANKKPNWTDQKNQRKKNTGTADEEIGKDTNEGPGIPPSDNIVENCVFDGGSAGSSADFEMGEGNTVRNCIFTKARIKVSPAFQRSNEIVNNRQAAQ